MNVHYQKGFFCLPAMSIGYCLYYTGEAGWLAVNGMMMF